MVCVMFFFKQKTAYYMRISDWNSDVCSSDLNQKLETPPKVVSTVGGNYLIMVGIVYYGAGNLFSLQCSLDRIGERYGLVTSAEEFEGYQRYIIPGVGHAGAAMRKLQDTGLIPLIQATEDRKRTRLNSSH